jgi:hypothetical protein
MSNLNIKQVSFDTKHYFLQEHGKKQIYLHHTAGGPNGENVFAGWSQSPERIATCVAINGNIPNANGQIIQGFNSKYWAYHLGLKKEVFVKYKLPFIELDRISIGIELCNWGPVTFSKGKYYTYTNREIPKSEVVELDKPFKGYKLYYAYTNAQLESTEKLLYLWKERYSIPIKYDPKIWDISTDALKGNPGLYTHNSVRVDKNDVYPCPRLIKMLSSLT